MNLTKTLCAGLLLGGIFSANSQNVASTNLLTSGGLDAGTVEKENAFYGYQAGRFTENAYNSFFGHLAGAKNVSGDSNSFFGHQAGINNGEGSSNTFIGASAGSYNYDGRHNVYVGYASGTSNQGNTNTFIGAYSGAKATGEGNVLIGSYAGYGETDSNKLHINNAYNVTPLIWGDFSKYLIKLNGKVGIGNDFGAFPIFAGGLDISHYRLIVKGGILTEEVRINLQADWADYVFSDSYKLKSLEEVEKYIEDNGHLPNVPSAKQVKEEGIELGEITKIQQEKIEELTLYLIQQNKEIQELKEMVKNLKQ
ncbi:MAG: hypothetical protein KAF41_02170 [Flavobacterium sp.]|nr:hypothetical protein [Flavobacterium sp.]PZO34525.1 MAG: hypothetical protein DCE86_01910 [Flavobacteriaceae bacterium]PZQ92680.1 MAG: hypothetical protein DI548_00310 [Flavobacterium johnsoniae]